MQKRQEAQKKKTKTPNLKTIYFNLEQNNWNITTASVADGHAQLIDAQNTTFPYVLINTSYFFCLNAE